MCTVKNSSLPSHVSWSKNTVGSSVLRCTTAFTKLVSCRISSMTALMRDKYSFSKPAFTGIRTRRTNNSLVPVWLLIYLANACSSSKAVPSSDESADSAYNLVSRHRDRYESQGCSDAIDAVLD